MAKGLNKVLKELKAFGKEAEQIIEDETEAIAGEITLDAKNAVRKDLGDLAQSIYPNKESNMVYSINVGMKYGAYVEFGTGTTVSVPPELKELAIKFKGKGVKQINLQPRPFLYPAFVKGRKEYLKNLKRALKDLKNKYG